MKHLKDVVMYHLWFCSLQFVCVVYRVCYLFFLVRCMVLPCLYLEGIQVISTQTQIWPIRMICLSTSFRLHSGLSGNSLAGNGVSSYVNLFILTYTLTFVFQRKIFFKVIVFIFHLCREHNYVTSSQDIILCGCHFLLLWCWWWWRRRWWWWQ